MSYPKLRGRIREVYGTQAAFAAAIKKDEATISSKLTGKTDWTRQEIETVCRLLDIPLIQAHEYFFCTNC